MTLNQMILGGAIVAGALLHSAAWAAPAADMTYPQVLAMLAEAQGSPEQVRPKLVGKTVEAKLVAGPNALWIVSQEDGVFFTCATSASGFKGGTVVAKVTQYDAPDTGEGQEPHLTLDNCAN